ncbi:hypothetical protein TM7_0374 [candidate division TM7 genomosp. GTL1]|nr:hypothetical protein TM7_0374 [candidate division TM7 genomosp. GTL1]
MKPQKLILIIGPPASGKTTLARKLEADLNMPVMGTDDIKERICTALDIKDDAHWSDKLNEACYDLLLFFAQRFLRHGSSLILESDFRYEDSEKIAGLTSGIGVTQVLLEVDHKLILERFKARWHKGERHPAQADNLWFEDLEKGPTTGTRFLQIEGERIAIDATSEATLNYQGLLERLS